MNLSEAERQVLATLQGAELEAQPTDRAFLAKRGERYWIFLEDWSDAFSSMAACSADVHFVSSRPHASSLRISD